MKKYEEFGIYDFDDFAEELDERELLFVNGGACGGSITPQNPTPPAPTPTPNPTPPAPTPTPNPTGPDTTTKTQNPPSYGQCGGNVQPPSTTNYPDQSPDNTPKNNGDESWKTLFPDPNGYNYDNEGIDPSLVSNKGNILTKEESDSAKDWMKDCVSTGDYKMIVTHSAYNNGIITIYSLFSNDGKKELVTYYDTNNDGVVDFAK